MVTKRADTARAVSARFFHAPKSFTGQQYKKTLILSIMPNTANLIAMQGSESQHEILSFFVRLGSVPGWQARKAKLAKITISQ